MLKYSQIYPSISTCPSPASSSPSDTQMLQCRSPCLLQPGPTGEGDLLPTCPKLCGTQGCTCSVCYSPNSPVLPGAPAQPSPCYRLFGEAGEICSAIQGAVAGRSGVCSHFNSSQTQQTGDFVASQTLISDDGNREMKAQQRERSSPSSGSDSAAFPC